MLILFYKKYVIIPFLLFASLNGNFIYSQSKQDLAQTQINRLAEGTLLIRIDDKEREIELLEESGDFKRSKKLKEKIADQNKRIIAAFREHYTFSKFCFYPYGTGKEIAKEGNFDTIYSGSESIDCTIDQDKPIYFLFFERKHWSSLQGHLSFVIYELDDNAVKRLESPFPFHFETKPAGFQLRIRYDFPRGVKIMNQKLEQFLSK